ncbi:DUF4913 domain-containing protein [Arsenicicoccus dermatophilus]|uniref:DUF4913 domain-containing protein n=1 Tax=Arsenicicoccus dermatophilus TaxID=1076331 RepID=UPI001F4D15CE|nr:DUF4913 domain-containing protein [Arsenicicoccus dermatophilus]MCH8614432.1 DUF4913 domain-containing protein [Arsenicicoccus dermatophilus]
MTPDRLQALKVAASEAAEAELNPPTCQAVHGDEPVIDQTSDQRPRHAPSLYYGSVDQFVREFLMPTYRRRVGEEGRAELRWSARWWESAKAIIRLEAMWRAWEHLRLNPATGISTWLRDHADHHMSILASPLGPFAKSKDTADLDTPLPYEAPPKASSPTHTPTANLRPREPCHDAPRTGTGPGVGTKAPRRQDPA